VIYCYGIWELHQKIFHNARYQSFSTGKSGICYGKNRAPAKPLNWNSFRKFWKNLDRAHSTRAASSRTIRSLELEELAKGG
jgi:hypothetical protein